MQGPTLHAFNTCKTIKNYFLNLKFIALIISLGLMIKTKVNLGDFID